MPNDFVDTFNSIIPSHIMKFIIWQDDVDSDVDEAEPEQSYEDDEVEDVVEPEDSYIIKNLLFNS